jgi:hypothetical protein
MLRHDLGNGVRLRLALEIAADPSAFRSRQDVGEAGLFRFNAR